MYILSLSLKLVHICINHNYLWDIVGVNNNCIAELK